METDPRETAAIEKEMLNLLTMFRQPILTIDIKTSKKEIFQKHYKIELMRLHQLA